MRRLMCLLALVGCDSGGGGETPAADATLVLDAGVVADAAPPLADAAPPLTDAAPPLTDAAPPGPDAAPSIEARRVVLPLGETLFFEADDYLWFWGAGHPDPVEVIARPAEAEAEVRADAAGARLTPDAVGRWRLQRGGDYVDVEVRADFLNADTFVNYNYTPVSPLAQLPAGTLWVTSPPSNAIQAVQMDARGGEAGALIPTGSWPTSVVAWPEAGLLLVAQTGRDSLGFVDPAKGRVVDAIRVGDEPAGLALDLSDPQAPRVFVTLSGEDAVIAVDLAENRIAGRVETGRDPRAMTFDAERQRLYVASLISGNRNHRGALDPVPGWAPRDVTVIDTVRFEAAEVVPEVGTINRGVWLDPRDPDRLIVANSQARNAQAGVDADSEPHRHRLATVRLDTLEVEQQRLGRTDASPFSMALTPDGALLVVTLSAGKALLALDPDTLQARLRLPSGHDPRGLAFGAGRVWTYAWLDNRVESWALPLVEGAPSATVAVGRDPTPAEVKEGQRIFNDAAFSRHGDFSCNNCHVDGLTDGLVWNILLDGDVNTISFRNVGGSGPFLWGGLLPTLFDFSREVLRLVGAEATGTQMERLTLYMQSVTAPPNPFTLPGGRFTEAALRGYGLFDTPVEAGGAGCGACHSGPLLTNQQVVDGKSDLLTDVPGLIATYDSGPWGRQAQWLTLPDMVRFAAGFTGASLDEAELADLLAYVQQLPGDRVYLTAAQPLNKSRAVWIHTPIQLTFSEQIAADQLDKLAMRVEREGTWVPLEGRWRISGRRARFERDEPLPEETRFRITIATGLTSTLGRRLQGTQHIAFTTGRPPDFDISGRWDVLVDSPLGAEVIDVAFIQGRGGLTSGVLLDGRGLIDIDHVEGFVSGDGLALEPFPVVTPLGDVQVERTELHLEDTDGDGFADRGEGAFITAVADFPLTATRTGLPAAE